MVRVLSLFICICLSISLSCCTAPDATPPSGSSSESQPVNNTPPVKNPRPFNIFHFCEYGELISELRAPFVINDYVEWANENYVVFLERCDNNELTIYTPQFHGKDMLLRYGPRYLICPRDDYFPICKNNRHSITLFANSGHGLPGIRYSALCDSRYVRVDISYWEIGYPELADFELYADAVRYMDPKASVPGDFSTEDYLDVTNASVVFQGKTYSALKYVYNTEVSKRGSPYVAYEFIYEDVILHVYSESEYLTERFWEVFSLKEYK